MKLKVACVLNFCFKLNMYLYYDLKGIPKKKGKGGHIVTVGLLE